MRSSGVHFHKGKKIDIWHPHCLVYWSISPNQRTGPVCQWFFLLFFLLEIRDLKLSNKHLVAQRCAAPCTGSKNRDYTDRTSGTRSWTRCRRSGKFTAPKYAISPTAWWHRRVQPDFKSCVNNICETLNYAQEYVTNCLWKLQPRLQNIMPFLFFLNYTCVVIYS